MLGIFQRIFLGEELGVCRHQPAVAAQSAVLAGSLAGWESSSPSPRSSSSASPPSLSPPPDSVVPAAKHMAKGVKNDLYCFFNVSFKKRKKKKLSGRRDFGINVFQAVSSTESSSNPPPLTITATDLSLTWSCVASETWLNPNMYVIYFTVVLLSNHSDKLMIQTWHMQS